VFRITCWNMRLSCNEIYCNGEWIFKCLNQTKPAGAIALTRGSVRYFLKSNPLLLLMESHRAEFLYDRLYLCIRILYLPVRVQLLWLMPELKMYVSIVDVFILSLPTCDGLTMSIWNSSSVYTVHSTAFWTQHNVDYQTEDGSISEWPLVAKWNHGMDEAN
jgi:hypothetical protein